MWTCLWLRKSCSASEIHVLRKISASKSKNRRASVCLCPSVSWAGGAEASLCELLRKSWSASEAKIERARVKLQSETEPLAANDLYFELRIWAYTWTFWNLNNLPFLLNTTPCIGEILFSNLVFISHVFAPLSLCDIIKHCRTAQISPCVSKCVELGALWKKIYCFVLEQSVLVSESKGDIWDLQDSQNSLFGPKPYSGSEAV